MRAHLDQIPEKKKKDKNIDKTFDKDELSELMYERYREIIHNDFRGLGICSEYALMYKKWSSFWVSPYLLSYD